MLNVTICLLECPEPTGIIKCARCVQLGRKFSMANTMFGHSVWCYKKKLKSLWSTMLLSVLLACACD